MHFQFSPTILLALLTSHIVFGQAQEQPAVPEGVEVIQGIEFAKSGEHSLTLDVYRPFDWADLSSTPVVIWIPDTAESKKPNLATYLAQQDMAVVAINYRSVAKVKWPTTINDCYAAVRWVRENASIYGFGPKIGVWGTMQGGQLASLLGTRKFDGEQTVSSQIQAVCNFYGPTTPIKDGFQFDKDASPLEHVSADDAKFLIVHAENDTIVPFDHSKQLNDKLKQSGIDSTLIALPVEKHDDEIFGSEKMQELVREFFKMHLF